MAIRRLTLEEWFLDYQLQAVKKDHFHLPFYLDIPLAPLTEPWERIGRRPPIPAMVIRACGVLASRRPDVNRMLFRTPLGPRIVEFDTVAVNVPVLVKRPDGTPQLSAATVGDACNKSIDEIGAELRVARNRDPSTLPIGKMFVDGGNNPWRRLKLRVAHAIAFRIPAAYVRGGGGAIAVTSLWHRDRPSLATHGMAYGPNSLTVGIFGSAAGMLRLGVGFDHALLGGDQFLSILGDFTDILADPLGSGLLPAEVEEDVAIGR